jgi:tetratricopeptide (TPR) repeat protein
MYPSRISGLAGRRVHCLAFVAFFLGFCEASRPGTDHEVQVLQETETVDEVMEVEVDDPDVSPEIIDRIADRSLEDQRESPLLTQEKESVWHEADRLYERGDFRGAISICQELHALLTEQENLTSVEVRRAFGFVYTELGKNFEGLEEHSQAMNYYSLALLEFRELGDSFLERIVLDKIFDACRSCTRERDKVRYYEGLVNCFRRRGERQSLIIALRRLSGLADVSSWEGLERVRPLVEESEAMERELGVFFGDLVFDDVELERFEVNAVACYEIDGVDVVSARDARILLGLEYWKDGRLADALSLFGEVR